MTASGVVAVQPAERVEVGLVFAGPVLLALERLALESRVEGSASALSALEPIELMDWRTLALRQASAPPADRTTPSSPWRRPWPPRGLRTAPPRSAALPERSGGCSAGWVGTHWRMEVAIVAVATPTASAYRNAHGRADSAQPPVPRRPSTTARRPPAPRTAKAPAPATKPSTWMMPTARHSSGADPASRTAGDTGNRRPSLAPRQIRCRKRDRRRDPAPAHRSRVRCRRFRSVWVP